MQDTHQLEKPDREIGLSTLGTRSRLRVRTLPESTQLPVAQAFWDLHAGTIEHHIVPHDPYHSFIRGDGFRIETDADGRPVFLELIVSKCIRCSISHPVWTSKTVSAAIRFLDLRVRFHESRILFDAAKALALIELGDFREAKWVGLNRSSSWAIDQVGNLAAVLIEGIRLDLTGGLKMAWRREAWQTWRAAERLRGAELLGPRAISVADLNDPA